MIQKNYADLYLKHGMQMTILKKTMKGEGGHNHTQQLLARINTYLENRARQTSEVITNGRKLNQINQEIKLTGCTIPGIFRCAPRNDFSPYPFDGTPFAYRESASDAGKDMAIVMYCIKHLSVNRRLWMQDNFNGLLLFNDWINADVE
jgi:hypothetical protein